MKNHDEISQNIPREKPGKLGRIPGISREKYSNFPGISRPGNKILAANPISEEPSTGDTLVKKPGL